MSQPDPVIELQGITFGYDREVILQGVSLEVHRRDFLAIVGPNGGGKTTLLLVILGLLRPWGGTVRRRLGRRRGAMGYVPQFASFERNFPLRVRDVILMGRLGQRGRLVPYNREDRQAVAEIVRRFDLTQVSRTPVGDLSGGQLQRVLIARALVSNPEILLLDEPLASIDADSRRLLVEVLSELNRRIPVVVVTHHLDFLTSAVNRQVRMNRRLSEVTPASP